MIILLFLAKRSGGSQQQGAAGSRPLIAAALLIASGREPDSFAVSIMSKFWARTHSGNVFMHVASVV